MKVKVTVAIALVKEQTALTEMIRRASDTYEKSTLFTISKEVVNLWVC